MKKYLKTILPAVALATVVFVARGSGHVPRQLLLISDQAETLHDAGQAVPVVPAPAPRVIVRLEDFGAVLPQEHPPISPDPALPSLGDRSPPSAIPA